ncbi:recQ mediated genome instability 1 [Aphomia sociella]
MSTSNLLNSVRAYLSSLSMFVDDDWISGFMDYMANSNCSEQELFTSAKEQWLLNDLKEICPGCLPHNLKNEPKTMLQGRYALQVNAVLDIGTPAYQQYLKLQKVNVENIEATTSSEDKIPSNRMLKLLLTDGEQDVTAIEYKPMRNINCYITPGCKIYVKGPVECRRGVLLITESAVELIGGEVQDMIVNNSVASIIAQKLNLPISNALDTGHSNVVNNIRSNDIQIPPQTQIEVPSSTNTRNQVNERTFDQTSRPRTTAHTDFVDDDNETDLLLAAIDAPIVDYGKRPLDVDAAEPEKRIKIDSISSTNTVHNCEDDNDIFDNEDLDYLRDIEDQLDAKQNVIEDRINKVPIAVSKEPFVYIKQINDLCEIERAGKVFRVKAQIIKLLSKLSVGKDSWSLRCTIIDGTGSLDVDFTSDVLSKLVGLTPQEMNSIKKQMTTKPEMKEKAVKALSEAKANLQVLYCIIEITMQEVPKITSLVPFESAHVDNLIKRVQDSGL